jgi:uncharacterized membrane protein
VSARPRKSEGEDARRVSEVAQRAIRRLDILEYVMFAGGAVLALAGGAGIAWVVAGMGLWDFRSAWIGASLVLFVVPGAITVIRIRIEERAHAQRSASNPESNDG